MILKNFPTRTIIQIKARNQWYNVFFFQKQNFSDWFFSDSTNFGRRACLFNDFFLNRKLFEFTTIGTSSAISTLCKYFLKCIFFRSKRDTKLYIRYVLGIYKPCMLWLLCFVVASSSRFCRHNHSRWWC